MGWTYMVTCITDFIIFPVLWAILQAYMGAGKIEQWDPLTLQGAGLYHIAMGAVLGVAAWSRGQEKIARNKSEYNYEHSSYEDEQKPRRSGRRPMLDDDEPI